MEVKILEHVKKQALKLGYFAAQIFWQSIEIIKEKGWNGLVVGSEIRDFKGKQKGAFEVRISGYRTVFTKPVYDEVVVMDFFKKEGEKLKKSELKLVTKHLSAIKKFYEKNT